MSLTFTQAPVLYVLGNHEFYGQKTPQLIREVKEITQGTNVHVLEKDRFEIGEVLFLGATLWTDFALNGNRAVAEATAATGMTDFRRIRVEPSYRKFRPADARLLHAQSMAWLGEQVRGSAGRKMVVTTHHAPSPRFSRDPRAGRSAERSLRIGPGAVRGGNRCGALDSRAHAPALRLPRRFDPRDRESTRLPGREGYRL